MIGKIIYLTDEDDVHSLRDRLAWAASSGETGRLIVVMPSRSQHIYETMHFDLIRRAGQQLGCEVALVSSRMNERRLSNEAGLPSYRNVRQAKQARWEAGTEVKPLRRLAKPRRFIANSLARLFPKRSILRNILRVGVALATVTALGGIGFVLLPRGQVSLVASSQNISTITTVALDSRATKVNLLDHTVPAQKLETFAEGTLTIPTTGRKEVSASKAGGIVTFFNLLNQPYTVPQNSVVRTSGGSTPIRFITTHNQEIPPLGRAEVRVQANEEGAASNVGANQINQVEGVPSVAVRVINQQPIGGGSGKTVKAVSRDDYKKSKAILTAQLLKEATEKLQKEPDVAKGNLYLIPTSIFIADIQNETYDRFATEVADELRLDMRIQVAGLAVSPVSLSEIARAEISKKVPRGFSLVEIEMDRGDEVEEDTGTRTKVFVTVRGKVGAEIDPVDVRNLVRGKTIADAQTALQRNFPLQRPPQISVSPSWAASLVNRLPFVPMRIQVDVKREG
ncbi:MAG: baseplate J/gp47 family protein [Anaerolineae bacterium]|nr:baseplate J/gp47 family protein [Anaerolineae bacterium]